VFDPIPDLTVCVQYFEKCEAAKAEADSAQEVGDLLLEFEAKYPIEWECSGWKNEFVADLVLGNTQLGNVPERKNYAVSWLSRRWQQQEKIEKQIARVSAPHFEAACEAVFDLDMLQWTARLSAASNAFRRGDLLAFNAAFDTNVDTPHTEFIRWLNTSWEEIWKSGNRGSSSPKDSTLIQLALAMFRTGHPSFGLSEPDLARLCDAFLAEWRRAETFPVPPSAVLLQLVAKRHKISSARVRRVAAEIRKRVPRHNLPRGKSASATSKS
jgi:hypothetical protein